MQKRKVFAVLDSKDIYGKERANIEVYHTLQDNGFDVTVGYSKVANEAIKKELSDFKSYPFSFPRDLVGKYRAIRYLAYGVGVQFEMAAKLRHIQPDYILIPTEWALFYLYLVLLGSTAKVVFRCGDDPISYRKRGKKITSIYAFLWKHFILKRVDILVSNAKYIQSRLKDSGRIDKGADRLIYNYPPARLKTEESPEYLFPKKALQVGCIGRIVPEKGVMELLEALSIVIKSGKNCNVVIAGDLNTDPIYSAALKDFIAKNKLDDSVIFTGKINNVNGFYQSCDVIAIPSIYEEPMANVVAESKSYSKPCIIFNQGGMPEIVEHKKTGYVCNKVNAEALAEALTYYIDHQTEAQRHGKLAYESIEYMKLSRTYYVHRWLDVFNQ